MGVSFDTRGFFFAVRFAALLTAGVFAIRYTADLAFAQAIVEPELFMAARREFVLPDRQPVEQRTIRLAFVGDIMLGRGVEAAIVTVGGGDFGYPFQRVAEQLRGYDILFGNLEGPISVRGADGGSRYSFRMAPPAAGALSSAGFDIVSVANNHIGDWGSDALDDTSAYL